jgi:hypothetical protein
LHETIHLNSKAIARQDWLEAFYDGIQNDSRSSGESRHYGTDAETRSMAQEGSCAKQAKDAQSYSMAIHSNIE